MKTLAALALLALVAAPAASAPKTPTADDVVARYVAARGGLQKIRSVQTLRQKGLMVAGPDRQGVVTRELKRPSRSRIEFKVQGVTAVYVSDGKKGWQVSPFEGDPTPKPLSDEAVREAAEQGDFEGPLVDWKAKGHKVELAGTQPVGGQPAYDLKITLAGGGVAHAYVDAKTYRLVQAETTREVRGKPVRIRTSFADFKKVQGLLFPGRVEIEAEGRPSKIKITVDSIEVNPSLPDDHFKMIL